MASSKEDNSYMEELLTCSVCLDLVSEPHTLAQCLHNYCKPCVQHLLHKQANPSPGVVCPLCRKFSSQDNIKPNHFVKELLAQHRALDEQGRVANVACEKCEDPSKTALSTWRCEDCSVYMCDTCKSMHSRLIEGHRLLDLTEQTQLMRDQLLFCVIHTDQSIKFYCNQCNKMLCNTCHVITHRHHDIVTIEDALEKMLPSVKHQAGHLDETIKDIEEGIQQYVKEEEDTKKNYQESRQDVDEAANEKFEDIRKEQQRLKDDLTKEEKHQIQQIRRNRRELINKKKELSSLGNMTLANIEPAQHVKLSSQLVQEGVYEKLENVVNTSSELVQGGMYQKLEKVVNTSSELVQGGMYQKLEKVVNTSSELVQEGVYQKLENVVNLSSELVQEGLYETLEKVNNERLSQTMSLNTPKLLVNRTAWNKLKTEGLIGTINNNVRQISWNESKLVQHTGGKYFDGNFTDVFAKSMKKVLKIPLPDQCQDLLVYDDKIWVPLRDQNAIFVYTEKGQLEKTINLEGGPTCIDQTAEGEILVSCHQKGMYQLTDEKKPVLIDSGFYCDFCICGDGIFALDYVKHQVNKLKKECGEWTKHEQIYFGNIGKTHIRDTLLVSDNQLEFFISLFTGGKIFKWNVHGKILQQYQAKAPSTKLCSGLCAVDSLNQLLFVEELHQGYRILNTVTSHCSPKYHTDLHLLNIKLPQKGIIWICHSRGVIKFTL